MQCGQERSGENSEKSIYRPTGLLRYIHSIRAGRIVNLLHCTVPEYSVQQTKLATLYRTFVQPSVPWMDGCRAEPTFPPSTPRPPSHSPPPSFAEFFCNFAIRHIGKHFWEQLHCMGRRPPRPAGANARTTERRIIIVMAAELLNEAVSSLPTDGADAFENRRQPAPVWVRQRSSTAAHSAQCALHFSFMPLMHRPMPPKPYALEANNREWAL